MTAEKQTALSFEDWIKPYFALTPKPARGPQRFEAFKRLCEALGHPERKIPAIHIAGTNGKGSVTTMVSRALWHGGVRVGAFTSPHLRHFSERIWSCGHNVPENWVVTNGEQLFKECRDLGFALGFFEWSFLLALRFFSEEKVDVMVIEAGIGGALDTTNVVAPVIAALTSVGKDHEDLLGSTIEEITRDKSGIFKAPAPAIIGPQVPALAEQIAQSQGCKTIRIPPATTFIQENEAIAKAVLSHLPLRFSVNEQAIAEGLSKKPFGRMEILGKSLVLDVAHNHAAVVQAAACIANYFNDLFGLVVCFAGDKDIKACLEPLIGKVSFFYVSFFKHPRCSKKEAFEQAFKELGVNNYAFYPEVEEGLKAALKVRDGKSPKVAILGSFYLASECLAFLDKQ